jgi:hypothetical protein
MGLQAVIDRAVQLGPQPQVREYPEARKQRDHRQRERRR